jgi:hypothetical protein
MIYVRNKRIYKGAGTYIGRPSPLGNPFEMKSEADREDVIEQYRKWLWAQYAMTQDTGRESEAIKELNKLVNIARQGKDINLICWCAPKPCHGDIIKDYIEWTIYEEILDPKCPRCSAKMDLRTRKKDNKPFWGCSRYPKCNGSRKCPHYPSVMETDDYDDDGEQMGDYWHPGHPSNFG